MADRVRLKTSEGRRSRAARRVGLTGSGRWRSLGCGLGIVVLLAGCGQPQVDWERLDDGVIRLIVQMQQGIGMGSAFAINNDGYYATNNHVIEASLQGGELTAAEKVGESETLHPATVVWHSAEKDLAIVHVPDWHRPALVLGDSRLVKKNQSVVTIGFPGASDFDLTDPGFSEPKIKRGVISARHTLRQASSGASVDWFEHDAIVNSGNSGGPLMDACGRVVGVNVAKASTDIGVNEFVQSLK